MVTKGKFEVRNRPIQRRAQDTFDLILNTTAHLLEEVGFDKLNTNLICKRSEITPPALYRYFPNKYSILEELGQRLMDAQNASSFRWMEVFKDKEVTMEDVAELLREQYQITCQHQGAKWIMRSLRSVPELAQVRFDSHELMIGKFVEWSVARSPEVNMKQLERRTRISNEVGYALIEMLLDRDDDDDDADEVFMDAAIMFASFDKS